MKPDYEYLLKLKSIKDLSTKEQIDCVGYLIDYSRDNSNIEGTRHALELAKQVEVDKLSSSNHVLYHYDIANAWSDLRRFERKHGQTSWNFESKEIGKEIYHLRKAISLPGFKHMRHERKCQIYTNLGNVFNSIGRFIEAQEYWNKAIEINSNFAMAYGNMGNGLYHYALRLFDTHQQKIFILFSYHRLKKALELRKYLEGEGKAEDYFKHHLETVSKHIGEKYRQTLPDFNAFSLIKRNSINKYRKWVLKNTLYINPLNDLGNYTEACGDTLTTPPSSLSFDSPPKSIILYNQIKEEFANARFNCYESINRKKPHYSDIDVILSNTDDPTILAYSPDTYSYNIEQLKNSFRISYSILDKIAYVLNDHLKIGTPYNNINFSGIWYSSPQKKELQKFFANSNNWALRGLYWLSKDLFKKDQDFRSVIEPEAQSIHLIRKFIEHRAFRVFDTLPPEGIENDEHKYAYIITRKEFEAKTLKLLKLTRAAIMYLSIAIHHEERKKDRSKTKTFIVSMETVPHKQKK